MDVSYKAGSVGTTFVECIPFFFPKVISELFHLLLWMFIIFLMIMQSQSGILFNNVVDDLSAMEFYGPTMAYLAIGGFFALHVLVNTQMVKPNSGNNQIAINT